MKHICIIAFLTAALYSHTYAQTTGDHAFESTNAPSNQSSAPVKKQPTKIKVTHIPAPVHKYGQGTAVYNAHAPKQTTNLCFPLSKDRQYKVYDFVILLQDGKVIERYKPFFDKHHLKFSGYVWEEILTDMLADADPEISRYVVLRSEGDKILIKTTKYKVLQTFPDYICHIFSNLVRFDDYLRKADKTKLPSY